MRQLGELESVVMGRLWASGQPMLVRDVLDDLGNERDLAYTTVLTVLENLRRKGFVTREKDGRANRYRPKHTREQYTAEVMGEVLASTGDGPTTLLRFVEQMSPDEIARLRDLLAVVEDRHGPTTE